MSFMPSLPGDTNLMHILMLAPERGKVLFEYTRAVMRDPSARARTQSPKTTRERSAAAPNRGRSGGSR